MWLTWLGVILQRERSLVWFPVSARAWVVGSSRSGCLHEATSWCFSLTSVVLSLPSPLSKNKERKSLKTKIKKITMDKSLYIFFVLIYIKISQQKWCYSMPWWISKKVALKRWSTGHRSTMWCRRWIHATLSSAFSYVPVRWLARWATFSLASLQTRSNGFGLAISCQSDSAALCGYNNFLDLGISACR